MRYAIVSDLHSNIRAWDAVLADLRAQETDVTVCLGDIVGYGPKPAEVLEAVRKETELFVLGNHDAAAINMIDYSIFNDHARQAIEWTITELTAEQKEFLSSVPLAIEAGDILFVHAEISEPGRFDYIDCLERAEENFKSGKHLVTFVGHTHLPKIYQKTADGTVMELADENKILDRDSRYIVNVGSVGEPRNPEDLRARYVIYDTETREVEFRRVEFDIVAYRRDLESTTLSLRPFFLRTYEFVVEGREVVVSHGGSLHDMTVAHNAASLVDLNKVSSVREITNSGALLKSAQPSKAPFRILLAAAVIVVGFLLFWMVSPSNKAPDPNAVVKYRKDELPEEGTKNTPGNDTSPAEATSEAPEIFGINIAGTGETEFWKIPSTRNSVILKSNEEAGAPGWEARRWFNLTSKDRYAKRTGPISVTGTRGGQINFEIINHRNFATFHWQKKRDDSDSVSVPNATMLDGHSNSIEIEADRSKKLPFPSYTGLMAFSDIPFETYDVAVYFGSAGQSRGNGKAFVRINSEIHDDPPIRSGGTMFHIPQLEPDGSLQEIKKSGDEGNYLVYRDLTLPTFFLQTWGEASNRIGVAGIQIKGRGKRTDTSIGRSKSSLKSSKAGMIANGKDEAGIQVIARDSLGRPLAGILVEPVIAPGSPSATLFPPKGQTDQNGIASFTLNTSEPGKIVISAKGNANGKTATFGKLTIESKKEQTPGDSIPRESPPVANQSNPASKAISGVYFRAEEYGPEFSILDQAKMVSLSRNGVGTAPTLSPEIAPTKIPLTNVANKGGLQIQSNYWEESNPQKLFNLERDQSFTCEAWIKMIGAEGTLFLFGTRTRENDDGWMVYVKGNTGDAQGAQAAFFYQAGGKVHHVVSSSGLLTERESHHLVAIWDHDHSATEGRMSLLVNGKEVGSTMINLRDIGGTETNPFSIGGTPNKGRVRALGIDEVRFTRIALGMNKLLSYQGIKGARLTGREPADSGIWNHPANWDEGQIPTGKNNAIITRGLEVTLSKPKQKSYDGVLVLEENAGLVFDTLPAMTALPAPSKPVILQKNARLVFACGHLKFPNPIKLEGPAKIFGSLGADSQTKNRAFNGVITGEHSLTVSGADRGQIVMNHTNNFSGGFTAEIKGGSFLVVAGKDKCLGTGNVTIRENVSLIAAKNTKDIIDDSATLTVAGQGALVSTGRAGKLQLDHTEKIAVFIVKGVDQGEGIFDKKTHRSIIAGPGKLVVKRP